MPPLPPCPGPRADKQRLVKLLARTGLHTAFKEVCSEAIRERPENVFQFAARRLREKGLECRRLEKKSAMKIGQEKRFREKQIRLEQKRRERTQSPATIVSSVRSRFGLRPADARQVCEALAATTGECVTIERFCEVLCSGSRNGLAEAGAQLFRSVDEAVSGLASWRVLAGVVCALSSGPCAERLALACSAFARDQDTLTPVESESLLHAFLVTAQRTCVSLALLGVGESEDDGASSRLVELYKEDVLSTASVAARLSMLLAAALERGDLSGFSAIGGWLVQNENWTKVVDESDDLLGVTREWIEQLCSDTGNL